MTTKTKHKKRKIDGNLPVVHRKKAMMRESTPPTRDPASIVYFFFVESASALWGMHIYIRFFSTVIFRYFICPSASLAPASCLVCSLTSASSSADTC